MHLALELILQAKEIKEMAITIGYAAPLAMYCSTVIGTVTVKVAS
jgi:hypothetical protein